jgi:P-type Mg2+ transporter
MELKRRIQVKESAFQTAWFIESVLTELLILFIIRTHKNFFKSKPSKSLFILSIVGLGLTIALPYLPFAQAVGLGPLPFINFVAMLLIVVAYLITADLYFKRL